MVVNAAKCLFIGQSYQKLAEMARKKTANAAAITNNNQPRSVL